MRHIPFNPQSPPPPQCVADAQAVTQELQSAVDKAARDDIIKRKAHVYRAFRDWLFQLGDQKCWFTEADDKASHMEVEHFRPKKVAKELDGTERDGYWWLAFDWHNFRLCGNIPNRKKGGYFPLRQGCQCATAQHRSLGQEEPYLLDPTHPRDPTLLDFDPSGESRPSALAKQDAWDEERVRVSIERFALDHQQLSDARKALWNQLSRDVNEYTRLLADGSARAIGQAEEICARLRTAIRKESRFSRAARTYLRMLDAELAQDLIETN